MIRAGAKQGRGPAPEAAEPSQPAVECRQRNKNKKIIKVATPITHISFNIFSYTSGGSGARRDHDGARSGPARLGGRRDATRCRAMRRDASRAGMAA